MVILHNHEVARQGLDVMVSALRSAALHCCTTSLEVALEAMSRARPDVLIIPTDLAQPALDALMGVRTEDLRLLALVSGESSEQLSVAARIHADGYVMERTLSAEELEEAIVGISAGDVPLPPPLARHVLAHVRHPNGSKSTRPLSLTARERQVLALLADGLSNKEIAKRLSISDNGVKRHVAAILIKMGCSNRAGAVATALMNGLLAATVGLAP